MLLRITIAVTLFGAIAALGGWWATDTLQRVILWGLLIWLLFESIEAILSWDHHPWRSYAITLRSFLRDHASVALIVPLTFLLTGIGVALIFTVIGRRTENAIWMLIGILVILAAVAAVGLVIQPHRPRAGRHGS